MKSPLPSAERIPVFGLNRLSFLEYALDKALLPSGYSLASLDDQVSPPRVYPAGKTAEEIAMKLAMETVEKGGSVFKDMPAIGFATIALVRVGTDQTRHMDYIPDPNTAEAFETLAKSVSGTDFELFLGVCIRKRDGSMILRCVTEDMEVKELPDSVEDSSEPDQEDYESDGSGLNRPFWGNFRGLVLDIETAEVNLIAKVSPVLSAALPHL